MFLFRRRLKTFNSFSNNAIVVLTKSVLNGGFFRLNNLSSSSRALFLLVAMTLMCLQLLLGIGVTVLLVLDRQLLQIPIAHIVSGSSAGSQR